MTSLTGTLTAMITVSDEPAAISSRASMSKRPWTAPKASWTVASAVPMMTAASVAGVIASAAASMSS